MLAIAQDQQHLKAQGSELDRGAASVAIGAERTCALTRDVKPAAEMIRFVLGPGDAVTPDVKRKLPGRGLWITASYEAIEDAVKRNIFARNFKRPVQVAPNLPAETERLLKQAAIDALAVASKAGLIVSGFAKVEAAIGRNEALALLHASDGAADGKRKLDAAIRRNKEESREIAREIAVIDEFTGMELDLALSRPNVVHAALFAGPGSETFLVRVKRLQRFRTGNMPAQLSMRRPKVHKDIIPNE